MCSASVPYGLYLQPQPDDNVADEGPTPAKRPRRQSCYSMYLEDDDEPGAMDELDLYLIEHIHDDSDILGWWRNRKDRFPRLAALAESLLIIPATSASSEREFSEAGHVYREKRLSLKPSTSSTVLFLNSNADLIQEPPRQAQPRPPQPD
ncbi:Putative AC9 transposase [Frankliniella fusca]|uniref:AC9 transposase n=1 Tax=Frankliniella fusca TaxID=407009 RepID=A0AAE1GWD0_9NEOP|nr:Putative AC9 transposase [Frankliniella fusca]